MENSIHIFVRTFVSSVLLVITKASQTSLSMILLHLIVPRLKMKD